MTAMVVSASYTNSRPSWASGQSGGARESVGGGARERECWWRERVSGGQNSATQFCIMLKNLQKVTSKASVSATTCYSLFNKPVIDKKKLTI